MSKEGVTETACPVTRAIVVLQEKWVLHIVHALLNGPRGFNELGRDVGGCNPTTLAQRLAKLEEVGLVRRIREENGGRCCGYELTASGAALQQVIGAIHDWSLHHLHHAERLLPDEREVAPPPPPLAERGPSPRRGAAEAGTVAVSGRVAASD